MYARSWVCLMYLLYKTSISCFVTLFDAFFVKKFVKLLGALIWSGDVECLLIKSVDYFKEAFYYVNYTIIHV